MKRALVDEPSSPRVVAESIPLVTLSEKVSVYEKEISRKPFQSSLLLDLPPELLCEIFSLYYRDWVDRLLANFIKCRSKHDFVLHMIRKLEPGCREFHMFDPLACVSRVRHV